MISYFPVVTGSLTVSGSVNISGGITASGGITISGSIASASFASTASFVALAQSASNAVSAQTASFANTFNVAGTLTATTLVVQTITSSVNFVTGSTRFGSVIGNTHVFTGSMAVSGGLVVTTTAPELTVNATGVTLGNVITDTHNITGSVSISGSLTGSSATFSGNVGIGTSSPDRKLVVVSSGAGVEAARFTDGARADLVIGFPSSGVAMITSEFGTAGDLAFGSGTSRTERMRITSGGNVGIGASINPQNLLEVSSAGGSPRIRVGTLQNNDNTARFEAITSNGTSVANSAWLRVNDAGGFSLGQSDYTKTGGDSGNFANLSSEVEYPRITVSPGGNVGIGTSSPVEKFTVVTGTNYAAAFNTSDIGDTTTRIVLGGLTTGGGGSGGSAAIGAAHYHAATAQSSLVFYVHDGSNLQERMRITSGGDVLINNTSTYGANLNVKGKGATGDTFAVIVADSNNATSFAVRNDKLISAPGIYGYAYASTANVFVQSDGYLGRNTSSLKYKHSVEDYTRGLDDVLKIRPVLYESKNPSEAGKKFTGFIAEEIDALGLTEFVQYAEDGTPDALQYPHFVALLVKAIQELKAEINELKNK
jgi:hypothetical protein